MSAETFHGSISPTQITEAVQNYLQTLMSVYEEINNRHNVETAEAESDQGLHL